MNNECIICYTQLDDINTIVTSCNHKYHTECINRWLINNNNCPICRTHIILNIAENPINNNIEAQQTRIIITSYCNHLRLIIKLLVITILFILINLFVILGYNTIIFYSYDIRMIIIYITILLLIIVQIFICIIQCNRLS